MRTNQTTNPVKANLVKAWLLQQNMSVEDLASSLRVSFYTVRKLLRGEAVSNSLIELLSHKTGLSFGILTGSSEVTSDVSKVKEG